MSVSTIARPFSTAVRWIGASSLYLVFGAALALHADGQTANRPITARGLTVVEEGGGQVIYDANNRVYWLADANFAASPEGRKIQEELGVTGIGPTGQRTIQRRRNGCKH